MNTKTEQFLIQWRRAILRGTTLKERLTILRQLANAADSNNEWNDDIIEHEKILLSNIEREAWDNNQLSQAELMNIAEELQQFSNQHFLPRVLHDAEKCLSPDRKVFGLRKPLDIEILLVELRRAVLAGSALRERLALCRTLSATAKKNRIADIWTDDVETHEDVRARQIRKVLQGLQFTPEDKESINKYEESICEIAKELGCFVSKSPEVLSMIETIREKVNVFETIREKMGEVFRLLDATGLPQKDTSDIMTLARNLVKNQY